MKRLLLPLFVVVCLSTVAQQQKDFQATVAQLTRRLGDQASRIEKVSALLEVKRRAPQMTSNDQ